MDLSEHDWLRLERYITRQGTTEELAELERWISASSELQALAEGMRTSGRAPGEQVETWDADAAWRRVSRRMRWFRRPPNAPAPSRRASPWLLGAVAASLALAAGSSLYLLESRHRATAIVAPSREVVTRRGERAAFNLADGSRVILGAESRLTIPAAYNRAGAAREVLLEGLGYFVVTHDSLRPFRVNTPLGTAEDLGTEFVVSTYPEVRGMRVVVAFGKVGLRQRPPAEGRRSPSDSLPLVTLSSGDLARLDSMGTATVRRVDPAPYVAWTGGALMFNGTPLRDVLPQLARWYDLDIHLADSSLGTRRLTATFRNQSISQVLDLMALSLDLRVERNGRTVTLRPSPSYRRS
jgi:ferric-dicitrate binding protein FerR (iron transport regulator)